MNDKVGSEFERVASSAPRGGIVGEFWYFLRTNKKWWLVPILAFMLLFGGLMLLSGTAVAPFIYTLF
jgi:Family of unknown function (DUF5989)